jgi:glycerophosphoryl diester phosphodiesterase
VRCAVARFVALLVVFVTCGLASATLPRTVGHRGLVRHAPEQTLPAFRACLDLRLDIELDVRRTKDGVLVCLHDETLNRTTDGTGKVAEMTLAELKKLDAGYKFDIMFAGERVPTLEEFFALLRDCKSSNTIVAVDLKVHGCEADCVALAKKYGVLNQLMFIGLAIDNVAVREKLLDADANAICAALCPAADKIDAVIADKTARWVYVRFIPTADAVKRARAANKHVFLVGPLVMGNEPENWAKGRAAGVTAILTDYPLECIAARRADKKRP